MYPIITQDIANVADRRIKQAAEHARDYPDEFINWHCTNTRKAQFKSGKITQEQALEYAIKRHVKEITKDSTDELNRLTAYSTSEIPSHIHIEIDYPRNRYWGNNSARATLTAAGYKEYSSTAAGAGYDKPSSAAACVLNKCRGVRRTLCEAVESALTDGTEIPYGVHHNPLPYIDGGIGLPQVGTILQWAGFKVGIHYGKHTDSIIADYKEDK